MAADTSLTLGKETRKRLLSLSKARKISAAELMRNLIDAEWDRENPPLAVCFWPATVRGDVAEPICEVCNQIITIYQPLLVALMSNGEIVSPICIGCAGVD